MIECMRKGSMALWMVCLVVACRLEPRDAPAGRTAEVEKTGESETGEPTPVAMPPMAELFTRGLEKPGPYEELRQSSDFTADAPHWLVFGLDQPVTELESISLLSFQASASMRDITAKLRAAAENEHVRGIVLRTSRVPLSMATAQDLREALIAFKGDGTRKVVCHTEDVSNATYHMLTACDQIGLAPLGSVTISGPAATSVHLKPLLDRIGVHADLLHVGDFKGAAEPLTRDAPSPQMLETLEAIVEQSYQTLIEGLVQGRKLSRNDAVAAVDRGLYVDGQARDAGLVDAVQPFEAFLVAQAEGKPWRRMQSDSSHPLADFAKIQRFLGMLPPKTPSGPHVAVVYAVGDIIDGHGQGIVGAREEIASRTLVAALRAIAANDDVKAVVLRIDSGGGSALASEQIWQAVHDLAERKPVVASMGSMAASGGYYIAAAATKIYARENTLTGSIGVVGGKLVFRDALENIGVRSYEVHRGERATLWSSLRPWSEAERATVQEMMEQTYEVFLERVGSGRKMERDAVHEIAQGRVWTGAAARERRLVDATGGLQEAVAEAARLGGIEPGQGLEVYPPEPSLRDILRSFGQVQSPLLSAWGGISAPSAPVVPGVPVGPVVMAGANATSAAMQLVQGVQALVGGAETYRLARVLASITTLIRLREDRVWAVSWVAPPL